MEKRGKVVTKTKKGFRIIPKAMKAKHEIGDIVPVSGVYECSICENFEAFEKNEHFPQCQDCINSHRSEDNKWYPTNEIKYFVSKNMDIEFDKTTSISIKIADLITEYAGTISFFFIHVIWFSGWILTNIGYFGPKYMFDPFPFGLLTMIVSLEAIFLSTFILMSQNIASKKSELRSEHEYQVNIETEKNVAEILALVKDIRADSDLHAEHISDLKETVEDISEHIESDENLEELKDKISEISRHEDKLEEHIENHDMKSYEDQEKLLDEIGIDMVVESAPTPILEEEGLVDSDDEDKQWIEIKKNKNKKTVKKPIQIYKREIIKGTRFKIFDRIKKISSKDNKPSKKSKKK